MLDVSVTASFLSEPLPSPLPTLPDDVPRRELLRSRAAARVGELAAAGRRRSFHHEHRVKLPLPDAWAPPEGEPPHRWEDGVLPEPKYGAFRHDLPVGSFNPGHRGKWSAHELCHALVGFAWRPDASPLFLATAGRLAEIVPVVLWYWLDEIGLRRCPRHDGPLFRAACPACARAAQEGPIPVDRARAEALAADAARFLDRELAAVARTRRLGVPCPHVWGSLDLCSDGIAYAVGHGPRLRSEAFARFAERFPSPVLWASLDDLEARVVEVARGIGEGQAVATPSVDWAAYDLGQRLLDVWADADGECARDLLAVADALAGGLDPAEVLARYAALFEEYELPSPEDVFALGYDVPGWPTRAVEQVREGLASTAPVALAACADAGIDLVPAFVAADRPVRAHLGLRFAHWLADAHGGPLADLAVYEGALRAAGGEAEAVALGAGVGARFVEGAIVRGFPFDVVRLAERIEAGEVSGRAEADRIVLEVDGGPVSIVFARSPNGDLVIAEVSDAVAADPASASPEERAALADLGVLVADSWPDPSVTPSSPVSG